MSEFYTGSAGWEHPAWAGSFYPDDLPAQWRLPFYANEFHAVVVPFAVWSAASPAQWLEDTPQRFRFFLQLPLTDEEALAVPVTAAREIGNMLGDRLGGFIGEPAAGRITASALDRLCALGAGQPAAILVDGPPRREVLAHAEHCGISICWEEGGLAKASGPLAVAKCPENPEAQAVRALIESLVAAAGPEGRALLVCSGKASSIALMHRANTIAELLGL